MIFKKKNGFNNSEIGVLECWSTGVPLLSGRIYISALSNYNTPILHRSITPEAAIF
jgi:hypothetical protein